MIQLWTSTRVLILNPPTIILRVGTTGSKFIEEGACPACRIEGCGKAPVVRHARIGTGVYTRAGYAVEGRAIVVIVAVDQIALAVLCVVPTIARSSWGFAEAGRAVIVL